MQQTTASLDEKSYKARMQQTTVYLDEKSYEAVKELPRKLSTSSILRHVLKGIAATDAEWNKYIKHNEEGQKVRDFLREKMKKRF